MIKSEEFNHVTGKKIRMCVTLVLHKDISTYNQ